LGHVLSCVGASLELGGLWPSQSAHPRLLPTSCAETKCLSTGRRMDTVGPYAGSKTQPWPCNGNQIHEGSFACTGALLAVGCEPVDRVRMIFASSVRFWQGFFAVNCCSTTGAHHWLRYAWHHERCNTRNVQEPLPGDDPLHQKLLDTFKHAEETTMMLQVCFQSGRWSCEFLGSIMTP
jgi:hypothetical protein